MAFKAKLNESSRNIILVLLALPLVATSNIDCGGKAFHCVNSTHFMICVDLGGGVSSTIDNFIISCPPSTECQRTNHFECEFPQSTTVSPITEISAPSELSEITSVTESTVLTSTSDSNSEISFNTVSITTLPEIIVTTNKSTVDPVTVNTVTSGYTDTPFTLSTTQHEVVTNINRIQTTITLSNDNGFLDTEPSTISNEKTDTSLITDSVLNTIDRTTLENDAATDNNFPINLKYSPDKEAIATDQTITGISMVNITYDNFTAETATNASVINTNNLNQSTTEEIMVNTVSTTIAVTNVNNVVTDKIPTETSTESIVSPNGIPSASNYLSDIIVTENVNTLEITTTTDGLQGQNLVADANMEQSGIIHNIVKDENAINTSNVYQSELSIVTTGSILKNDNTSGKDIKNIAETTYDTTNVNTIAQTHYTTESVLYTALINYTNIEEMFTSAQTTEPSLSLDDNTDSMIVFTTQTNELLPKDTTLLTNNSETTPVTVTEPANISQLILNQSNNERQTTLSYIESATIRILNDNNILDVITTQTVNDFQIVSNGSEITINYSDAVNTNSINDIFVPDLKVTDYLFNNFDTDINQTTSPLTMFDITTSTVFGNNSLIDSTTEIIVKSSTDSYDTSTGSPTEGEIISNDSAAFSTNIISDVINSEIGVTDFINTDSDTERSPTSILTEDIKLDKITSTISSLSGGDVIDTIKEKNDKSSLADFLDIATVIPFDSTQASHNVDAFTNETKIMKNDYITVNTNVINDMSNPDSKVTSSLFTEPDAERSLTSENKTIDNITSSLSSLSGSDVIDAENNVRDNKHQSFVIPTSPSTDASSGILNNEELIEIATGSTATDKIQTTSHIQIFTNEGTMTFKDSTNENTNIINEITTPDDKVTNSLFTYSDTGLTQNPPLIEDIKFLTTTSTTSSQPGINIIDILTSTYPTVIIQNMPELNKYKSSATASESQKNPSMIDTNNSITDKDIQFITTVTESYVNVLPNIHSTEKYVDKNTSSAANIDINTADENYVRVPNINSFEKQYTENKQTVVDKFGQDVPEYINKPQNKTDSLSVNRNISTQGIILNIYEHEETTTDQIQNKIGVTIMNQNENNIASTTEMQAINLYLNENNSHQNFKESQTTEKLQPGIYKASNQASYATINSEILQSIEPTLKSEFEIDNAKLISPTVSISSDNFSLPVVTEELIDSINDYKAMKGSTSSLHDELPTIKNFDVINKNIPLVETLKTDDIVSEFTSSGNNVRKVISTQSTDDDFTKELSYNENLPASTIESEITDAKSAIFNATKIGDMTSTFNKSLYTGDQVIGNNYTNILNEVSSIPNHHTITDKQINKDTMSSNSTQSFLKESESSKLLLASEYIENEDTIIDPELEEKVQVEIITEHPKNISPQSTHKTELKQDTLKIKLRLKYTTKQSIASSDANQTFRNQELAQSTETSMQNHIYKIKTDSTPNNGPINKSTDLSPQLSPDLEYSTTTSINNLVFPDVRKEPIQSSDTFDKGLVSDQITDQNDNQRPTNKMNNLVAFPTAPTMASSIDGLKIQSTALEQKSASGSETSETNPIRKTSVSPIETNSAPTPTLSSSSITLISNKATTQNISRSIINPKEVNTVTRSTHKLEPSLKELAKKSQLGESVNVLNKQVSSETMHHYTTIVSPVSKESTTQKSQIPSIDSVHNVVNAHSQVHTFCVNRNRGRYADRNDCTKFYICIGRSEPIVGNCPANTVFSEIKKQCTRNKSHCIRENEFQCLSEGRFSDILKNNAYYICIKRSNTFFRFKFQCQNGYYLNKITVRCAKEAISLSSTSVDNSNSERSISEGNSKEKRNNKDKDHKKENKSGEKFECKKDGKFPDPDNCRKFFVCTKTKKSEFRRRRKSCDSDEVYHKDKKKCVDADSYEC